VTVTKGELVAAMAEKAGISRAEAKQALDAFIASVVGALKRGDEVRLPGFGRFTPVHRPAGPARNPRTGETVRRAASATARFHAGEVLKNALNGHG
jgi:DNA-binding protein HU-beta